MSTSLWLAVGLIAGFVASKAAKRPNEGALLDIVLGVMGAVVGGFLFNLVGATGMNDLNLWSLLVAGIGAVVVLGVKHTLTGRRGQGNPRDRSTPTKEVTGALEPLPARRHSESSPTPGLP
jgi:uncharacterized membrane protein YeaQ/YmgE (transglycosylase-associated protein family)